jgi:hypothetical protein
MRLLAASAALLGALPLWAHVGSPDVFYEGEAGPYHLLVTIRPPQVIPGVAQIEIRSASPDARQIRIVPLHMKGPGATLAPVPDVAERSADDPQFYTGSLWLMNTGSWQVRVQVDGARGSGTLSVPVPAVATRILPMQRALASLLVVLGVLLFSGLVAIMGAGYREGQLPPGEKPATSRVRRAYMVMAGTAVVLAAVLWLGDRWWVSEAAGYQSRIFKPLQLKPSLDQGRLLLRLEDPGWLNRQTDDLIPDHNHLMHLYVFRVPELDQVWHLHPVRTGDADFTQSLPSMPVGRYALFGDIVHDNGFPDTVTAEVRLPQVAGKPLEGDDAGGSGPALSQADYNSNVSKLSGGYRMVWERGAKGYRSRQPYEFRFRLEDPQGHPAAGMEFYMGMQGHAAFVSSDLTAFAHVHPSGSVPMAALSLLTSASPHMDHMMMHSALPPVVSFPYGFPKSGAYRIFVQVKRAGKVETGIFDTRVEN